MPDPLLCSFCCSLLLPSAGWIGTLIAAGCMSALLFALGTFTPGRFEANDLVNLRSATLSTTNSTLRGLDAFAAAQTPPNATLAAQVAAQNKTFYGLGNAKNKWISNDGIINSFQSATKLQAQQLQP
jgi:hypothetical protein